jgi:hypothetical protein
MRIQKCRRIPKHSLSLILHAHTEMSAHTKTQSKSYITCAYRNVGVQVLTIRARRALHSALLPNQAEDLVLILLLKVLLLHLLVLKWDLLSDPPSLYGRRVRRTGTAGGTGTPWRKPAKMSAPYGMSAAADILTLSQRKSQKANFA